MKLKAWIESGKHLPPFLRDFHRQKDVFKIVGGTDQISWVTGHIYVIDRFLQTMARFGWTLQRSRARHEFEDLGEAIKEFRQKEAESLRSLLQANQGE